MVLLPFIIIFKLLFLFLIQQSGKQASISTGVSASRLGSGNASACSATCATGWTTIGCSCYKFQDDAKTWDLATADCTALGTAEGKTGRLVSITSSSLEVELLKMSSNEEFWTGGNDKTKQKTFVWDLDGTTFYDDGTKTGYNNWFVSAAATQPTHNSGQDCVKFKIKLDSGAVSKTGWDDISCDKTLKY